MRELNDNDNCKRRTNQFFAGVEGRTEIKF